MRQSFDQTEILLNADGSVYHLMLQPEELAPTVILVGDPGRVEKVSYYFDEIQLIKQHREFITHTGSLDGKRMSVMSSGIGTDNIDIVLNELDLLRNYDLKERAPFPEKRGLTVVRIGTSGAIQREIAVDSLLLSTHAVGLDNVMHYYKRSADEALEHAIAQQLAVPGIRPYLTKASDALLQLFDDRFMRGITLTAAGFYAPQGRRLRAPSAQPDFFQMLQNLDINGQKVSNLEMETSAIYGLSSLFGFEALSVNAILANRASGVFSSNAEASIDKAIQLTLETLIKND